MSSPLPVAGPAPSRRVRSLIVAFVLSCAALLGAASPALAVHLQGGYFTANVTADGHLKGTLTYLEVYACPSGLGSQKSLSISITSPGGQTVSKSVATVATQCDAGGSTYTGSFDYPLTTATFSSGAPDGNYVLEWMSGNRIAGIKNLANSDTLSVRFRAQVHKVTGIATGAPFLGSDVSTGIGIGDLYSQNLNASDPDDVLGNGTLTYQALTGNANLGPDTNIITVAKLQANGQVEIPQATTAGMSNGAKYVYKVRVTDDQGDYAERDVLLTAVTPNHPPVINNLDTTTGYDIAAGDTLEIPFNATDPDAANTVKITGASLPSWVTLTQTPGNPAQATLTLHPPADANTRTYRFNFDATDNDTTQVLVGSRTIEVRVAGSPETQLKSWPAPVTTNTSASFTFAAADPDYTFECTIDGTTWEPCASGKTYTDLSDGPRTFQVRANDGTKVDPSPASYQWIVDTTAPTTSFSTKPAAATSSTTANFAFATDETGSVTYECSLDGGSWSACTSPKAYTGLADGSHTLRVKATDIVGNVETTPASYTWTIDRTAPNTTMTGQPSAVTTSSTATFTATSTEPGSFECKLDGGAWTACPDPITFTDLADGSHTVQIRGVDEAGNADATPASYTWTIDATAPDTSITAQPASLTTATTASIAFTSADVTATFECKLDAGSWTVCVSPAALTGLADGEHTFEVRAVDPLGNTDATPASVTWTVDTTAPSSAVKHQPAAKSKSPNATFEFGSTDTTATFECRLDGGAWEVCTAPVQLTGLPDGTHTFEVRALDDAGNVEGTPTRTTWVVDTAKPTAPNFSQMPSPNASSSSFEFVAEPGATLECQLDGGAWEPCDATYAPVLSDGRHTLKVRQIDEAGNVSDPVTRTWVLDRTAPDAPAALSGPGAATHDRDATFDFTAEPGSLVECRIDGGAWAPCVSPLRLTDLSFGDHVLELRTTDAAGNISPVRTERWSVVAKSDPAPVATPTGPKSAKVEVSRSVAIDPKKSVVGCALKGVNISACDVAIYARKSELGLAKRGSKRDTLVRIGTGRAETDEVTGRVGVKVKLNGRGKRAMARPGGVKVRVNIKAMPAADARPGAASNEALYAHKYTTLRPATQLVVPSDGLFATDSAVISVKGRRFLQSIAGTVKSAKRVECIGHTDAQGPAEYNLRLGLERGQAVCSYLARLGVKVPHKATSAGESRPRATNMTAAGRELNRRVELSVRYE